MGSRRRHEPAPMNPAVVGACPEEWHGLMTKFLDACVPRFTRIPVDPDALTKTKRALARAEAGRSGMTTASGTFGGTPPLGAGPPQADRRGVRRPRTLTIRPPRPK